MDSKKDLFLYKGQLKNLENPFDLGFLLVNNDNAWMLYKKTEKLTLATYLITDFFVNRESLKWELRKKATSFLSFITAILFDDNDFEYKDNGLVEKGEYHISAQLSLLELAVHIHLLSEMNFLILRDEYSSLRGILEEYIKDIKNNKRTDFTFPNNYFSYDKSQQLIYRTREGSPRTKNTYKGHINVKDIELNKRQNNVLYKKSKELLENISHSKNKRREDILNILRLRGEVTIKDVSATVLGCSEKTIQRELMSLISEGVIKRYGERRWSTYKLA